MVCGFVLCVAMQLEVAAEPSQVPSPPDRGHRTTLPAPAIDTSDVSLWSLLRKNIGKVVLECDDALDVSLSLFLPPPSLFLSLSLSLSLECRKGFIQGLYACVAE